MKFFALPLATLALLLFAVPAHGQEPLTVTRTVTYTGHYADADPAGNQILRPLTMTAVIESQVYPYTYTNLTTGNGFVLEYSATFGDILSGLGSCVLSVVVVFVVSARLAARRRL